MNLSLRKKWRFSLWAFLVAITVLVGIHVGERASVSDEQNKEALAFCKKQRPDLPEKPFSTDQCSLWPQSLGTANWEQCCLRHDIEYWCGGTHEAREKSDKQLQKCVNEKLPGMGTAMFIGTKIGGVSFLPTPWRWGYGHRYPDK